MNRGLGGQFGAGAHAVVHAGEAAGTVVGLQRAGPGLGLVEVRVLGVEETLGVTVQVHNVVQVPGVGLHTGRIAEPGIAVAGLAREAVDGGDDVGRVIVFTG